MKVVYFGTPAFAAKTLQYLLDHDIDVVAVVTKPDKAQGRSSALLPTPVKVVAQAHSKELPIYQPEIVSALDFAPILEQYHADLFVVVAYGEILKQHLLDMPKIACINLHASLLPKYRGAAPIQRSIMNGEKETGVTIMHMVKKMDAGDMIRTVTVPIGKNTTYGELESELCEKGSKLLLEVIREFEVSTPPRTPQNHEEMTLAPKIELEQCRIDWNQSAQEIHDLVRGVFPFPGAWTLIVSKGQEKRMKILSTEVIESQGQSQPGKILAGSKEGICVGCGKGSILIKKLQVEGKKGMEASEFLRGVTLDSFSFH